MLKRTNYNPDDDELLKLISCDSLRRNQDIADMLHLLMNIDGGLSIFLDGDWGSGKTYFVRSLKVVIDKLNASHGVPSETIDNIANSGSIDGISWQCNYLPIYYNAWSYDYWGDPLASIACTLAAETDEVHLKSEPSDGEVAKTALKELAEMAINRRFTGLGSAIDKTVQAMEGEDLLDALKKRSNLRDAVAKAVNLVLKERANKLLLIVDELDRCEPKFACKLLEELKAMFELENVVVLYSVNAKQLARVIEGQYGSEFNGDRYLSKFYDIIIPIRTVSTDDYLTHMDVDPSLQSSFVIKAVTEAHDMSLREVNRLIDICKPNLKQLNEKHITNERLFRVCFMDIVEAGIKVSDPSAYDRLVNKGDYSVFSEEVMGSKAIRECFVEAFRHCIMHPIDQDASDDKSYIIELIDDVAALRWSNRFDRRNTAQIAVKKVTGGRFVSLIERRETVASPY